MGSVPGTGAISVSPVTGPVNGDCRGTIMMDLGLLVTSAVVAAIVSALASLTVAWIDRHTTRQKGLSDKAWADYELRRDRYFQLSETISSLFQGGNPADRAVFLRVARTVRLVGSDEVVRALNCFTDAIKTNQSPAEMDNRFRSLFNAMRQDIRRIDPNPPTGTALGPDAFPIES